MLNKLLKERKHYENCRDCYGELTQRLSHSRWNCKYHIVFAPKYRRKVFYAEKKAR